LLLTFIITRPAMMSVAAVMRPAVACSPRMPVDFAGAWLCRLAERRAGPWSAYSPIIPNPSAMACALKDQANAAISKPAPENGWRWLTTARFPLGAFSVIRTLIFDTTVIVMHDRIL
jgi:hypothetical protein